MAEVQIGEVMTDIVVQESVGPLGPEEVRRLVAIVLEQVQRQREMTEQRERDTKISNRAYQGRSGANGI